MDRFLLFAFSPTFELRHAGSCVITRLSVAVRRHKNGSAGSDSSSPVNTRVLGRLCEEKKAFKSAFLTMTTTLTERRWYVCKVFGEHNVRVYTISPDGVGVGRGGGVPLFRCMGITT